MIEKLVPLNNHQEKEWILIVAGLAGCSWYLDRVQWVHVPGQSFRL